VQVEVHGLPYHMVDHAPLLSIRMAGPYRNISAQRGRLASAVNLLRVLDSV